MKQDILFMPLGGGQRVGASCYYLRIGETNILLDAGIGICDGVISEPDLHSLLVTPYVQSLNQIDHIFISHAHADHVGFLLKLMKSANRPTVYMTEMTLLLTKYQLYDKNYMFSRNVNEEERLAAQLLLDKVVVVSFMQTMNFGKYRVTFLPAGHIPGAMMLLFEWKKRRILYTGDYSLQKTPLTDGCMILEDKKPDTIIMCGLHAKHPKYVRKKDSLYQTLEDIFKHLYFGKSVKCSISQLSKGIEFLKLLNQWNVNHIPIYIDNSIMTIVQKMEQLSIPILTSDNYVMNRNLSLKPHIYLTSNPRKSRFGSYEELKVDFSLHEDFSEMKHFIKMLNPKQAYMVHCAKEISEFEDTIEQELMFDGECRTQFTFAEEQELYLL